MKSVGILVIAGAAAVLLACSSGSTSGTTGDGGTADGGGGDGGTGGSTTIDTKDLDGTCSTTSDCVAVKVGNACAICSCPNGVIAKKDQAAYDAKYQAARNACGPLPAIACNVDCAQPQFSCSGGKCVYGIAPDGG